MTPIGIQLKLGGDREVEQGLLRVRGAIDGMGSAAATLARSMGGIGGALAGAFSVHGFVQAADAVTTLNNQLKLATGSSQQAAQAYGALFDIAQRSRVSFVELGGTFASIARATGEMGISQQRLLGVTEAIGNAVTVSGSSAQAANAALMQLGQGLASGTLRGEELNSVMEQTPRLAKALADGMGVSIGELRKLGSEGAITSEQVIKALESQAGKLQGEVKDAVLTVGQAFTQLKNSATVAAGDLDKASGASQALSGAMSGLSGAIDTVGAAIRNHEGAFATLAGGVGGAAAVAGVAGLGAALVKVGTAAAALGAVLAANPAVLALLGIGVAVGAGITGLRASSKTADGIQRAIDSLRQENERSEAAYARAVAGGRDAGAANILRVIEQRKGDILKLQAELYGLSAGPVGGGRGAVNPDTVGAMNAREAKTDAALAAARRNLYGVKDDYEPKLKGLAALYDNGNGPMQLDEYRAAVAKLANENYKAGKSADSAARSQSAMQTAYQSLMGTIGEKIGIAQQELAQTGKLSESQRLSAKIEADLLSGKLKLTDAGKADVKASLDKLAALEQQQRLQATERANAAERLQIQDELNAAYVQESKAREAGRLAVSGYVTGVAEASDALRHELSLMGLSQRERAIAIEQYRIELDLKKQIAAVDANVGFNQSQRNEEIARLQSAAAIAKANASSKVFLDDWKQSVGQYDDIFRKGFADMLNNGKDGWKSFTRSLVTTFKTSVADQIYKMFAQPFLMRIVASVAGVVGGGVASAAQAASGGAGIAGAINTASSLNTLYGTASQALYGGVAGASAASLGYANAVGLVGGDAIGALAAANGMWAGVATGAQAAAQSAIAANLALEAGTAAALPAGTISTAAGGAAAGGGGISGALASIPGWGWAAMGVLALLGSGAFSSRGANHSGGVYSTTTTDRNAAAAGLGLSGDAMGDFTQRGNAAIDAQLGTAVGALSSVYQGLAKYAGDSAKQIDIVAGFAVNGKHKDEDAYGYFKLLDKLTGETLASYSKRDGGLGNDPEKAWAQYVADMGAALVGEIRKADIPKWMDNIFAGLGDSITTQGLDVALQQIAKVDSAFTLLGNNITYLADISGATQTALLELSGGIDALMANAGAYYENFYSADEQRAAVQRQLQKAFDGLNLKLPDIDAADARAQFRSLAEAQDLTTEAGRKTYASLLQLSGAFASITQSAEDAAAAAKQLAEEQERARQDAIRSASDLLRRSIDRDRDALRDQASGMQDVVSALSASVSMLKSNARELYGQVDGTAQMLAAQGMVYIEQALGGVRAGASITDYTGLTDAISAARGGINTGAYASQFERERDALVLAGQLSELGELGDLQLSIEERQLKALTAQIDALDALGQRADDLINGTTALTGTVQSYFDQLLKLLNPEKPEEAEKKTGGVFAIGGSAAGGGGDSGTPYDKDAAVRYTVGAQLQYGADKGLSHDDPAVLKAINAAVYGTGITQADIAKAYGVPEDDIARLFAGVGLPKFDVGTNRVPRTGLAVVHEGEAIIPKAYNPWAGGGQAGGSNADMVAELRALREEVAQLRAASQATASSTAQMAEQLDQVTEGGNAMRTEAIV